MTENEAVLNRMKQYRDYAVNELNMCGEMKKDFDTAIQALEEVQQYRAIEKRLADMFGDELSLENYVDMLEETLEDSIAEQDNPHIVKTRIVTMENVASLEAYRTIGTVEECQSAVDKQAAKKPRLIGNAMICPSCPKVYSNDRVTYCLNCGQKIDWG